MPRVAALGANFTRLLTAQAISNIGNGLVLIAFPLLALRYTHDPALVAGVAASQAVPWLLFSLPVGAFVDRVNRRHILIVVDSLRTLVLLVLGVAVLVERGHLSLVYAAAFCVATGEVFFSTASEALVPELVDDEGLEDANGRLESAAVTGEEFIGPALGGLCFALLAALPFLIDAFTFAASAAVLLRIRERQQQRVPSPATQARATSLWQEVKDGLSWLAAEPVLRILVGAAAVIGFFQGALWALFVLYGLEVLGIPAAVYGLVWAMAATADVAAGLLGGKIRRRLSFLSTFTMFGAVVAVAYLVIGATSNPVVFTVALAAIGFANVISRVATVSLRQRLTPPDVLARVVGASRFVVMGSDAVGAVVGGLVARELGLRVPFLAAGVLQIGLLLIVAPLLKQGLSRSTAHTPVLR